MVTGSSAMTIVEQLGRFASHARRGELLPGFRLPAIDGSSVSLESYRGRTNLVFLFAGDKVDESPVAVLLEELVARREEFTLEAAQVLVVATSQLGEVPLPKRRPLLWVVAEPLPQIRARRDILEPPIELQTRLPDTPRP